MEGSPEIVDAELCAAPGRDLRWNNFAYAVRYVNSHDIQSALGGVIQLFQRLAGGGYFRRFARRDECQRFAL